MPANLKQTIFCFKYYRMKDDHRVIAENKMTDVYNMLLSVFSGSNNIKPVNVDTREAMTL